MVRSFLPLDLLFAVALDELEQLRVRVGHGIARVAAEMAIEFTGWLKVMREPR
jgi:hypothetical protein